MSGVLALNFQVVISSSIRINQSLTRDLDGNWPSLCPAFCSTLSVYITCLHFFCICFVSQGRITKVMNMKPPEVRFLPLMFTLNLL